MIGTRVILAGERISVRYSYPIGEVSYRSSSQRAPVLSVGYAFNEEAHCTTGRDLKAGKRVDCYDRCDFVEKCLCFPRIGGL